MSKSGDTEEEIMTRITKANIAFAFIRNFWKAKKISTKTKIKIFKSNVISTLLYGSESWKITKSISHKLEVFQNKCLRRNLKIFWPYTITNSELHERMSAIPITQLVMQRRWWYIGHILRMPPTANTKSCIKMDTWWQKKAWKTKRDLEKIGGETKWREEMVMGGLGKMLIRPATMESSGVSLMCIHAPRGLSK